MRQRRRLATAATSFQAVRVRIRIARPGGGAAENVRKTLAAAHGRRGRELVIYLCQYWRTAGPKNSDCRKKRVVLVLAFTR